MAYKIIVSPRAQREIENAIDYYSLYSVDAPQTFIAVLKNSYDTLATSPFFRIRHKNIRALKIKKFPYSLSFCNRGKKRNSSNTFMLPSQIKSCLPFNPKNPGSDNLGLSLQNE